MCLRSSVRDGETMSFLSLIHHPQCILEQASKTAYQVFSRTVTTLQPFYPQNGFLSDGQSFSPDNNFIRKLISLLQHHDPIDTPYILNSTISSCARLASLSLGEQVHTLIVKLGFASNIYVCSSLVYMYGKCGRISNAQRAFDEMPYRNEVTWNSLISGYLHSLLPQIAVNLFMEMLELGIKLTAFSFSSAIVGCSQLQASELGIQVHALSFKYGFCSSIVVETALIDMYSKCFKINDSRWVFDQMIDRNVITWTSMVCSYAQNHQPEDAMNLVKEMLHVGIRLNYVTYNSLLSSFSSPDYLENVKQVHCRIIREGFESNPYIVVALLTVYSECNDNLDDFRTICFNVTIWDQISFNAIISGFSDLESGEEALKFFSKMRQEGVTIDFFTFTSVLKAIGTISSLNEGKKTHGLVVKTGYISNVYVQNGLVSMYAKCGAINNSERVFASMSKHDLISWNSLISGYTHHGHGVEAIELFGKMRKNGVRPNKTTFLSVLSACSHVGLLQKALEYFDMMKNDLIEPPTSEHYAIIVDLFGRAGLLHEAEEFINSMPIEPGLSVFKALFSGCKIHGNREIALRYAKRLMELCPSDPAVYILLSNVLADGGNWNEAAGVRKLMSDRKIRKKAGCSWI